MSNKWWQLKVSQKLVLFSLITIFPLLIIGGNFFSSLMAKQMFSQIERSLKDNLHIVKYHLNRELEQISTSARIIASDQMIRKALDNDNSLGLNAKLNQIISLYPNLNYLILLDDQKNIFAINTTGLNGQRLQSEELLGYSIKRTKLLPKLNDKTSYTTPIADPYLEQFNLTDDIAQWFSSPIKVRGKTKGWIVLSYKWQATVSTTVKSLLETVNSKGFPTVGGAITDLSGKPIAGILSKNKNILEQAIPLTIAEKKYSLVLQIDKSITNQALKKQKYTILTVILPLLALLLALLYFVVYRQILKPIKDLEVGAKTIAAGELSYTLSYKGHDELGQLAISFNDMSNKLSIARSTLESKVEQRTNELSKANEQLKEAVVETKEANKIKGEFLASMSHEIRTPMNGVLGMLSLLEKTMQSDEQHHFTKMASNSAKSLLVLINDILDFSKIEAGKLDIEAIDFNIESLFAEFSETVSFKLDTNHTELILDLDFDHYQYVKGDPGRIRQILHNLVGNAIKFTPNGEVLVAASITPCENHLTLKCEIKDTGIGIEESEISNLFSLFTQVDSSTTRRYGGTGLGLAIVKQLCELMDGRINVASKVGQGSIFSFQLLLEKSSTKATPLRPLDLNNKKVLIVDDNETCRYIFQRQLEPHGVKVTQAAGGSLALEELSKNINQPFDAALIDMQMPDMDGKVLGKLIRENKAFDMTKLILCTSMTNKGDAKLFKELGFQGYIPKPATARDICSALNAVIHEKSTAELPMVTRHSLRDPTHASISLYGHILLVEDNRINQMVAKKHLENLGLKVSIANHGQEALDLLKSQDNERKYSLIIMDCQMPILDGYQATKAIRADDAGILNSRIKIIAMTANAMAGDKEKCLAAGMDDYLSKPIDAQKLADKLEKYLPH